MLLTQLSNPRPIVCLISGLLSVGMVSMSSIASSATAAIAPAHSHSPGLLLSQALPDFEEDDEFEQAGEGFHAVYIDRAGNVLGTFVNIPDAKIQVYADGQIAIAEQNYTVEPEYDAGGRLHAIGRTEFSYFSSGRLRQIDDIDFRYYSSGRLRDIENIDFSYFSSGRLQRIEEVRFNYDANGRLKRISAAQTRSGIYIVVVD